MVYRVGEADKDHSNHPLSEALQPKFLRAIEGAAVVRRIGGVRGAADQRALRRLDPGWPAPWPTWSTLRFSHTVLTLASERSGPILILQ